MLIIYLFWRETNFNTYITQLTDDYTRDYSGKITPVSSGAFHQISLVQTEGNIVDYIQLYRLEAPEMRTNRPSLLDLRP